MIWTNDTPFQALSLKGGGYRGLFTARALQVIEEHVGVPIGRRFDLTVALPSAASLPWPWPSKFQ